MDHFSRVAADYAARRPGYPDGLFAYLAALPRRRELAWDCGAGSGQATLSLARHFRQVLGTDASAAQLAAAPSVPGVEYRVADAGASGLEAGSTDLVAVAQALHWFDLASFYPEVERVLAPGGVVAAWTYGLFRLGDERLDRSIEQLYGDVLGPFWPPERRHVDAGYRTLPFPFMELEPRHFEMRAQWTLADMLGYIGTWSAVDRYRAANGSDPLEALGRELSRCWGGEAVREIRWPLSLRAGTR